VNLGLRWRSEKSARTVPRHLRIVAQLIACLSREICLGRGMLSDAIPASSVPEAFPSGELSGSEFLTKRCCHDPDPGMSPMSGQKGRAGKGHPMCVAELSAAYLIDTHYTRYLCLTSNIGHNVGILFTKSLGSSSQSQDQVDRLDEKVDDRLSQSQPTST
jgi:hypothetical protein